MSNLTQPQIEQTPAEAGKVLLERITDSSYDWPGPPLNERPEWLHRVVSQVYALIGAAKPLYVGHSVQKTPAGTFVGEVVVVTEELVTTSAVGENSVTTKAEPLSAATAVEVLRIDHVFNQSPEWPRSFEFAVTLPGRTLQFPVSDRPEPVQHKAVMPTMQAFLRAMK